MFRKISLLSILVIKEHLYRIVGKPSHSFHATAARSYCRHGMYRNAIRHCICYLELAQADKVKVILGYCYVRLEDHDRAVRAFRSMENSYESPNFALAHALAEAEIGNVDTAREIVDAVRDRGGALPQAARDSLLFLDDYFQKIDPLIDT